MPDDRPALFAPKEGLSVEFLTVEELFGGSYTFDLPWFQRAYAWTEDLAQRLLRDICQAHIEGAQRYFIGHILLSRKPDKQRYELVDGQQRTVTLIILFTILRRKLAGSPWAERLSQLIEVSDAIPPAPPVTSASGSDDLATGPAADTESANHTTTRFRLSPQPTIAKFFHDHVQSRDAAPAPTDGFDLSEVESNILNNRDRLDEMLDDFRADGGNLASLAQFLLTRCLFVLELVETDDENEAWRMLQTEENTGLPFHNSARAKVTLVEVIAPAEREAACRVWEATQAKLGNDGMQQLLTHIRDLSRRRRSSQPVEKDILNDFALSTNGLAFMRDHLAPSADRLFTLRTHNVGVGERHAAISHYLRHIDWAGHVYWCPAGMRWLEIYGDDHRDAPEFFRLLARKVWMLRIAGADSVEHERRFISLASEILDGVTVHEMTELAAQPKWIKKVREGLLSRTFYDKRYSRPLLRYLSDIMGADSGEVDGQRITIEHVLPKNPGAQSHWLAEFGSPQKINEYAHRIGNMAFLSFSENQRIGNRDYTEKRAVLARSGFILSTDAAATDAWSAKHITKRSEALARVLFDHWQLKF